MKIRDITLRDICLGKNWRYLPPDDAWLDEPMEEWGPIEEAEDFSPEDLIVYSGITVYESGRVAPVVWLREVQYLDFGGDYCEFANGCWRQLGLEPNTDAEHGETFFANPLNIDPSFDSVPDDYREHHRNGFQTNIGKLQSDA